jgi:hypothetical protein
MKTKLTLLFFVLCALLRAQTFVPATVVTFKKDTLKGEAQINTKKPLMQYEKVIFRDLNGIQKNYKADKLLSYTLENDAYIGLDNDGEPRFYKVLAKGAVNLYELGIEMQIGNKIVPDKEYYLSYPENKRLVEVKRKKFKRQISDWLKENPALADKYDTEEFDAEKAAALINEYNLWLASKN